MKRKIIIKELCKNDLEVARMLEEITKQIHGGLIMGYNLNWEIISVLEEE